MMDRARSELPATKDASVSVSSVAVISSPLDGDTYRAGENLEVRVTFNEPVVNVSGGLSLQVGSNTKLIPR